VAEDGLINDYVFGQLNVADAASFRATLTNDPERRFKLDLTLALREKALAQSSPAETARPNHSFFDSIKAFFSQPKYVGAFAVLLIAALFTTWYLTRRTANPDDLAELRTIYGKERPTEARISEFSYAPVAQLRGEAEEREKTRLRRIELSLIQAMEKNPNAQTHHALGVFYLTQRKYPDAIREFDAALKTAPQNAKIHNDLGSAHFEQAKASPQSKSFESLAKSLEEFTAAVKLDPSLLEALFNQALAQQELGLPRQAKESWNLYLQKDPSSPWADEARRHLARIGNEQSLFKSPDTVLTDFLDAFRQQDQARAQKIHNETKGPLNDFTVPLQLSDRYLSAKQKGDEAGARECLAAMEFIGRFEQSQNSEFFFLS
jgi:tetratricopeptide (TPR) repeat protein